MKQAPVKTEVISYRCYPAEKRQVRGAARRLKMDVGTFLKLAVLEKLQRSDKK